MTRSLKTIGGFGIFVIACIAGYFYLQHASNDSAMKATIKWAQVERLPKSATNITVETKDSIFAREFVVTFDATAADISSWLSKSAGTANTTPEYEDGVFKYQIEPGDGAQFAEVQVDDYKNQVEIRVY